jgi:hypothetical protein
MTIKYAEVTIIINQNEETIFEPIFRFFGYENIFTDNDIIIISFDDGTVCDVRDEYENNNKFKFACKGHDHLFPINFEINGKTFFYKRPIIVDGVKKINFDKIMKDNKKYKKELSIHNVIFSNYYDIDVFAIVKISSNKEKPRYHVAYDDEYFDKSSLIYLTDYFFRFESKNEMK